MITRLPMIRTDESNAFAHNTMKFRFPKLLQEILDLNQDYSADVQDAILRLKDELHNDAPIRMIQDASTPDYPYWQLEVGKHAGDTWLNTEWLFAEMYCFRQVVEIVRWWETRRDPYAPKKEVELGTETLWQSLDIALSAQGSFPDRLAAWLEFAVWGNRIDLSYAVAEAHGAHASPEDLLADEREVVVNHLMNEAHGEVHIIVDNAGTELTMDLVLIDGLLQGAADRVVMHVKAHPTYVSDATFADVLYFIELLKKRGYGALAHRLVMAIDLGRLQLLPDLFWNSGRLFDELPSRLQGLLRGAKLLIVKGDANYRRLLGDAVWDPRTPFADAIDYLHQPVVALRTLKSDPIVGLRPGLAAELDALDGEWRVNGKRGLIQSNL